MKVAKFSFTVPMNTKTVPVEFTVALRVNHYWVGGAVSISLLAM